MGSDLYLSHDNGRFFSISRPLYGEHICPWKNGKYGSMVDIYDSDTLRFIEYLYEQGNDNKDEVLLPKYHTKEEREQAPIVADGIVVYWMKWCCDNALQYDVAQLFDDYYAKNFNNFVRWVKKSFDYWKRKDLVPLEFAKKHLSDEKRRIATSKALSQYLPESDMNRINDLAKNYIEYVQEKIKQLKLSQGNIPVTISTEKLKSAIFKCKNKNLLWSTAAYAVFYRVLQQDFDEKCSRSIFEERLQLMGFTDCTPGILDNSFRNNKFLSSSIEKWPKEEGQNKDKAFKLAEAFREALED